MKTTMRLQELMEIYYNQLHPEVNQITMPGIETVINEVQKKVFDFDYPLDDTIKDDFEKTFLAFYAMSEIGQETVALWKHYLKTDLRMKSYTYNELLKTTQLEYDIINPLDYTISGNESENKTENSNRNSNSTADSTTNNTTTDSQNRNTIVNNLGKEINTPQSQLQDFLDGKYMSSANQTEGDTSEDVTSNGTSETENNTNQNITEQNDSSQNGSREYETRHKGRSSDRPVAEHIEAYRNAILNIISYICSDLEDLFLLDMNMSCNNDIAYWNWWRC